MSLFEKELLLGYLLFRLLKTRRNPCEMVNTSIFFVLCKSF
jgi:hypothetical protein